MIMYSGKSFMAVFHSFCDARSEIKWSAKFGQLNKWCGKRNSLALIGWLVHSNATNYTAVVDIKPL